MQWERVEIPASEGWYAFRGICKFRSGQQKQYATLFMVNSMSYGSEWGVRTNANSWRPVEDFEGEWYRVVLPWEDKEN